MDIGPAEPARPDAAEAGAKHNWLLRTAAVHAALNFAPVEKDCGAFMCSSLDYYTPDPPSVLSNGTKLEIEISNCHIIDARTNANRTAGPDPCYVVVVATPPAEDDAVASLQVPLCALAAQLVWLPGASGKATLHISKGYQGADLHLFASDAFPAGSRSMPSFAEGSPTITLPTGAHNGSWCRYLRMGLPLWHARIPLAQAASTAQHVAFQLAHLRYAPRAAPSDLVSVPGSLLEDLREDSLEPHHLAGAHVVPGQPPHSEHSFLAGVTLTLFARHSGFQNGQGNGRQPQQRRTSRKIKYSMVHYAVKKRQCPEGSVRPSPYQQYGDVLTDICLPAFHCFLCSMRVDNPQVLLYHLNMSHGDFKYTMETIAEPCSPDNVHRLIVYVSRRRHSGMPRAGGGLAALRAPQLTQEVMPQVVLGAGQPELMAEPPIRPSLEGPAFHLDTLCDKHIPKLGDAPAARALDKLKLIIHDMHSQAATPALRLLQQQWGELWETFLRREGVDGHLEEASALVVAFTRCFRGCLRESDHLARMHMLRVAQLAGAGLVDERTVWRCARLLA